jgi:hypothetical protein
MATPNTTHHSTETAHAVSPNTAHAVSTNTAHAVTTETNGLYLQQLKHVAMIHLERRELSLTTEDSVKRQLQLVLWIQRMMSPRRCKAMHDMLLSKMWGKKGQFVLILQKGGSPKAEPEPITIYPMDALAHLEEGYEQKLDLIRKYGNMGLIDRFPVVFAYHPEPERPDIYRCSMVLLPYSRPNATGDQIRQQFCDFLVDRSTPISQSTFMQHLNDVLDSTDEWMAKVPQMFDMAAVSDMGQRAGSKPSAPTFDLEKLIQSIQSDRKVKTESKTERKSLEIEHFRSILPPLIEKKITAVPLFAGDSKFTHVGVSWPEKLYRVPGVTGYYSDETCARRIAYYLGDWNCPAQADTVVNHIDVYTLKSNPGPIRIFELQNVQALRRVYERTKAIMGDKLSARFSGQAMSAIFRLLSHPKMITHGPFQELYYLFQEQYVRIWPELSDDVNSILWDKIHQLVKDVTKTVVSGASRWDIEELHSNASRDWSGGHSLTYLFRNENAFDRYSCPHVDNQFFKWFLRQWNDVDAVKLGASNGCPEQYGFRDRDFDTHYQLSEHRPLSHSCGSIPSSHPCSCV